MTKPCSNLSFYYNVFQQFTDKFPNICHFYHAFVWNYVFFRPGNPSQGIPLPIAIVSCRTTFKNVERCVHSISLSPPKQLVSQVYSLSHGVNAFLSSKLSSAKCHGILQGYYDRLITDECVFSRNIDIILLHLIPLSRKVPLVVLQGDLIGLLPSVDQFVQSVISVRHS